MTPMTQNQSNKGTVVTKPSGSTANKADATIPAATAKAATAPVNSFAGKLDGVDGKAFGQKSVRPLASDANVTAVRPRKPATKPDIAEQIGQRLRGVYNDVLAQPIPGRFLDLLAELEAGGPSEAGNAPRFRDPAAKKEAK